MKNRIIILILAILLLLTGCTQVDVLTQEPEIKLAIGTIPENISTGEGRFAMSDGFVYAANFGFKFILEYDTVSGKMVPIDLPKKDPPIPGATSILGAPSFYTSLFLLRQHVAFVSRATENFQIEDENGKMQWSTRKISRLMLLEQGGNECTIVPELGDHVYKVIPVKKNTADQSQKDVTTTDNPLAGVELYYYFGYDTFPEIAAQMEDMGITLKEPTDPNERSQYFVDALGYMDGDTRQTTILTKDFGGWFHVDDQYIYTLKYAPDGTTWQLYQSNRDEIDFQYIELGEIGNCITSYDGGFYFYRLPSMQICYYKDGKITELPIAGSAFKVWRDHIIFLDNAIMSNDYYSVKSYNVNTGEVKKLCDGAAFDYQILGDNYLGYIKYQDDAKPLVLINLETGEEVELYRNEQ